LSAID